MISHLDHLVLTTFDLQSCITFYTKVLGMELQTFGHDRKALVFGHQKINLHVKSHEWEPKAHQPTPGALDLCFISQIPLEKVIERFNKLGIAVLEGPVMRTGATGPIRSIYLRDPDANLIEIAEPA